MLCPRCDGQGKINKATLHDGVELFICDECDASWKTREDIGQTKWFDLVTYLESCGYRLGWNEIKAFEPMGNTPF